MMITDDSGNGIRHDWFVSSKDDSCSGSCTLEIGKGIPIIDILHQLSSAWSHTQVSQITDMDTNRIDKGLVVVGIPR